MGLKKSKEFKWLAKHCACIFFGAFIPIFCYMNWDVGWFVLVPVYFAGFVAVIHGMIDVTIWNLYGWVTWQANKDYMPIAGYQTSKEDFFKTFRYWEDSKFYAFIGFDQMLHYLTLIVAVFLLT
jgi:hypothetical protein